MAPLIWVALGLAGGLGICALAMMGLAPIWMLHAERGVDPFASLPGFDDDEAQDLLERGA